FGFIEQRRDKSHRRQGQGGLLKKAAGRAAGIRQTLWSVGPGVDKTWRARDDFLTAKSLGRAEDRTACLGRKSRKGRCRFDRGRKENRRRGGVRRFAERDCTARKSDC